MTKRQKYATNDLAMKIGQVAKLLRELPLMDWFPGAGDAAAQEGSERPEE